MAAGLYAVYRNPGGRFGWLLLLAGVLWSPTMLAESFGQRALQHRPGLGLVCRAAAHLSGAGFPHRSAGQPGGSAARPRRRRARVRCTWCRRSSASTPSRARGPPAAPIAQPTPSCCRAPSPASSEPCSCRRLQAASVVLFAAVALQLLRRLVNGSNLMRVELVPVLAAAVVRMLATVAFLIAREVDATSPPHRGARLDRATGDARRIGRVPDRACAVARPRRASALGKLSGVLGRPSAQELRAGDRGGGRRSVAEDRLSDVWRSG